MWAYTSNGWSSIVKGAKWGFSLHFLALRSIQLPEAHLFITPVFSLSLCGPISISRANAHMVHMG